MLGLRKLEFPRGFKLRVLSLLFKLLLFLFFFLKLFTTFLNHIFSLLAVFVKDLLPSFSLLLQKFLFGLKLLTAKIVLFGSQLLVPFDSLINLFGL